MKTILRIELFNENIRDLSKLYGMIFDSYLPGLSELATVKIPRSGWVAEITGYDPKYKYQRKFIKCKKDYSKANMRGSRGLYAEYILESGRIYEVKSQVSWKRFERYFCQVTNEGDVKRITIEEVDRILQEKESEQCQSST